MDKQYYTIVALEDAAIKLNYVKHMYSLEFPTYWSADGITWGELPDELPVKTGDRIMLKRTVDYSGKFDHGWLNVGDELIFNNWQIAMPVSTGKFNVEGNIMSMVYGDNFKRKKSLRGFPRIFLMAFKRTKVVDASKLVLPAIRLEYGCYRSMFRDCELLKKAPELPTIDLIYGNMFNGCTSLTMLPLSILDMLDR